MKKNNKIESNLKILFYTHNLRTFRSTLIGYLYEITQVYSTILLSEELDFETEEILKNKKIFPKLEKIIPIHQFTGPKMNLFVKNNYLFQLAKNLIKQYSPNIVIAGNDVFPFEMYLMRFAKKINALSISMQPYIGATHLDAMLKSVDLTNVYTIFPSFLPNWLSLFFIKIRRYLGHFLYYWILPLLVGEKPFFGKSSFILRRGLHGMMVADFEIVFSRRDYSIYCDVYKKYGISIEKLYILSHPLVRKSRKFFQSIYFNKAKKNKTHTKIISLMLSGEIEIGFRRKDQSLITIQNREEMWIEIVKLINKVLYGWKIFVKPHPETKNMDKMKEILELISENVKVVDSQEPADKYIEVSDIVVGLPLSASNSLFFASLQCPGKSIISLDFHQEILGDMYKDFPGIIYFDNKDDFIGVLELIKKDDYNIKNKINKKNIGEIKTIEFADAVKMLEYLFKNKKLKNETFINKS